MKNGHYSSLLLVLATLVVLATLGACTTREHAPDGEIESESWAATAWGEQFEIFAETDSLKVGSVSVAFTHVTILEDFSALEDGTVSVILRNASGAEASFSVDEPTRAGIFSVPITPATSGEFELVFRVETPERREDIPAGRVQVGEVGSPGGLVETAPLTAAAEAATVGAPISFLKEQQWRTRFATSWLGSGALRESVRGPGRVRAAAGGEVLLTSPVDGIVSGTPWLYPGQEVRAAAIVFRITPRVSSDRSLPGLEADVSVLEAELEAALHRRERLEGLLELGATSRREFEEAKARATTLESRLAAAQRDLATAGAVRRGGATSPETVAVSAPFRGRIARIDTTPGQVVAAGTPLGLLVRERPLWVAVALRPEAAAGLGTPEGLELRLPNASEAMTFHGDRARLVSLSPIVDPQTGTVTALFELDVGVDELPIGSPLEAEVLLAGERAGVVVPETALIDDSGVMVAYLQVEGESFVRTEVTVLARQSGKALVVGLPSGARLVEQGGNAIRRATLVAKDVGEGHVH